MKRTHAITTAVVVAVLAILVYMQFRHWRSFDWTQFWAQTRGVNIWSLLIAVAFTYFVYFLRAVRWSIFLRPTKPVPVSDLVAPQFIGFTGLALLGRPGEFVRPYIIARREDLSFSSQLAVWAVERVFDISSVALLLGVNLAIFGEKYKAFPSVQEAGYGLLALAVVLSVLFFALWWKSDAISAMFERILAPISKKFANAVCSKLRSFGEGLHTIQNFKAFLAVLGLSLAIWLCVAEAYIHVTHAYPTRAVSVDQFDDSGNVIGQRQTELRLHQMALPDVLLVMGASMAGSIVQLPGVGGGSQLAVIGLLSSAIFRSEPYNVTREVALSCGMMLWLVTFMSVIPAGLLLARRAHISLREVSEESETKAEEP